MAGAKEGADVLDFNSAYLKRHNRVQPSLERKRREVAVEAIIGSAGNALKNVIATIDLEDEGGQEALVRTVRQGDAVVASAGNAAFAAVFTHMDEHGRLVFMVFNNGRYEGEHQVAIGGEEKIWGGMRMDFSTFTLKLRRLQLYSAAEGVIGCVEISAAVDSQPAF